MKKKNRFLSFVLACLLLVGTCVSAGALSYGKKSTLSGNGQYDPNWLYWSQGASEYESMRKYGCYLVAASKLMAESGTKSSASFDPDDLYTWCCDHDYLNSKRQVTNLKKILENYTGSKFSILDSEYKSSAMSYASVNTKVMNYLNDGYYVIVQKPGHFMYVAREKSINAGKIVISNSQSDIYNGSSGHGFKRGTDFAARLCKPLEDRTDKDKIHRIIAVKPANATPPDPTPVQKGNEEPKTCSHSYNSRGYCSKCGQEFVMTMACLTSPTTYEAVKNDVPVRNRPYAPEKTIRSLAKGEKVTVTEFGNNSVGNRWYKLSDDTWVYSENLKESVSCNGNHTKGKYLFYEDLHPHKNYWECANCGAWFTDGSTEKMPSCEICNPPKKAEPTEPAKPAEPTYTALVTCNADILNVRTGPGTSYDKVGGLERGSKCTVYPNKASNGWLWVEGSGVSGYAASNKLTTYTGNTRDGLVTCKADLLNVRKGPGTSYDKVGQIPRGATCTVYLDVKADWYFVSYGGFSGYASKNMITLR